jgi:protein CpxP
MKASEMNIQTLSRTTRRMLLAITCAAALASPILAQDPSTPPPPQHEGGPGGGPEMQQKRLEHMTAELNLTPDQVSQIKAIQDDGRQQMTAMRNDSSISGADRHAKMTALRDAQDARIKSVLTDEQKTKYDAMQANMRQRRGDGGQAPAPPPPAN